MRRALVAASLLGLLLVACATPVGEDRSGCGAEWQDVEAVAAMARGTDEQPLRIECMHQIANRRLRVGFILPPGPSCHLLRRVVLVESADAISITLFGAVDDDPNAGACPDEERMVVTEIDVAAPVGDRALLDGSGG
jgi:hypothetical protein